ncbi:hypothetical protein XI02_42175 [Bradyrhizobium sp. CCBAU 21365]|nr:hypothetical protein XI02_42175 [Bradyrhizobium sp. CCBAU 21365]
MRPRSQAAMACAALMLSSCFESSPKLSKNEEGLLEAVVYLFTGLEDNAGDRYGLKILWQRSVKGRTIEYRRVSKNGIGFSK